MTDILSQGRAFQADECPVCGHVPVDIAQVSADTVLWKCPKCGDASTFQFIAIGSGPVKLASDLARQK